MKKIILALLSVWVIKYEAYTGGEYVPCANSSIVQIAQNQFQRPLCVNIVLETKEWPIPLDSKSVAEKIADMVKKQNGVQNVRVEERKTKQP